MIHRYLPQRIQFIIILSIVLILIYSTRVIGQTISQSQHIQFIPPPPPNIGEPDGRSRGAASRGPACQRYEHVMALVPSLKTTQNIPWGLTTATHPTLWFYAPQGLAANIPLEFILHDETGQNRYRNVVQTPETPIGVFSLSLPATADALQLGKTYQWSVSIYCDAEVIDTPITMKGHLQRIALPARLQNQLDATSDILERAILYAKNGIWYDTLTTLGGRIRQGNDVDVLITSAWTDLLKQANLNGLDSEDVIVPCCAINGEAPR